MSHRWWVTFLGLAVAGGAVALVAWYVVFRLVVLTPDSDFFSFWAAGRLLGTGGNPYDPPQWLAIHQRYAGFLENPYYVYPLPLAVLFIPLGWLSEPVAGFVWLCLSQVFILVALRLSFYPLIWSRVKLLAPFMLAAVCLFRPAIITLLYGQLSPLWLLSAALAAYAWARGRWFWGGMAAGLLCLKPAGPGLLLALMVLWLALRRQWRGLAGIGLTALILGGSACFFRPDWLGTWLTIGQSKVAITLGLTYPPTIWGAVAKITGGVPGWPWLAGMVSGLLVLAGLWVTLRAEPAAQWRFVFGVLLPVALVVTPYLWNYDQVMLLVPLMSSVALLDDVKVPFVLVSTLPVLIDLVGLGLLAMAIGLGHDVGSLLLPVAVGAVFAATWVFASRRPGRTEGQMA